MRAHDFGRRSGRGWRWAVALRWRRGFAGLLGLAGGGLLAAAEAPLVDWFEQDFPFVSSVLEVKQDPVRGLPGSRTPRGLLLRFGGDGWVALDVDLMRVAAVWQGPGFTPVSLAPASHLDPRRSGPGGQELLPEPLGRVWLATGVYPGWQVASQAARVDPREPARSPEEVGRGPLPESVGRLRALRHTPDGVVLEYQVGTATARELFVRSEHQGRPVFERHVEIGPASHPLVMVVGETPSATSEAYAVTLGRESAGDGAVPSVRLLREDGLWQVRIEPRPASVRFCVAVGEGGNGPVPRPRAIPTADAPVRWPGEIATTVVRAAAGEQAWVVDDIPLPLDNPWRRNVRLADVQFLSDGTAFGVTLDGDVWRIRGLASAGGVVHWRRFAAGFHEPMSLAVRADQVHVFDRNGIWRLVDADGNGEAEAHVLFSNAFAQTADRREFPNGIRLAPGGEFVIAKGGQQATTLGKHNGSVLRVSADGRHVTVLGYGFRQPFLGVNPRTGMVTASDQQGQYVPTTPLHEVRDGQFYGFLSNLEPREQYPEPVAEPLVWLPHAVNASGASQVWLQGTRMGELDGALLHLGFNRPEVFRVLLSARGDVRQAAVVSLTQDFAFPPLSGAVNPVDGQVYISGFQIFGWGTTAARNAGLARLRHTGRPGTLPREVLATPRGILLGFDRPVDPASARATAAYRVATWRYERTHKYGSPQLRKDGTAGIDWHSVTGTHVSRDGRRVLLDVPSLEPAMQLRVGWSLAAGDGRRLESEAYLSPRQFAPFDAAAEGFAPLPEPAPVAAAAPVPAASGPVSVEEGRRLAQLFGCAACHSTDGVSHASIGPTWRGLYGSVRQLGSDVTVTADEAYLRESILEPAAKLPLGYRKSEYAMPSYAGVLDDAQIDALILYLKSLR